jgi:hypothetical protein
MPTLVLTDAVVLLDGASSNPITVDISDWVKSVTINYSGDMLEDTAMGDTTHSKKPGLKDWSIDLELFQDFVDDGLDEDIWTAISGGLSQNVEVRATSAARGAGNPAYTGLAQIESFTPIAGSVGEMAMMRLRLVPTKKAAVSTHADHTLALQRKVA